MVHGVVAYLGVPLRYRESIIVVLNAFGKRPHTFDEEEVNLLRAFADQAAIAIQKTPLNGQALRSARLDAELLTNRSDEVPTPFTCWD